MSILRAFKAIFAVTLLSVTSSGWAVPISDVGGLDNFVAGTYLAKSGDAFEESWVESMLGIDVVLDDKYDTNGSNWQFVDGSTDIIATQFADAPDYFLVKTGKIFGTTNNTFLFQNVDELYWGVISLASMGITGSNIEKISHLTLFDSPSTDIPEPGVFTLLVLGVMGLLWTRRQTA